MSDQPKGEWTNVDVEELLDKGGSIAVKDAHNAAIAAERDEAKRQHEGWVRADKATTIIYHENEKLKQQLAAERKAKHEQLAAAVEALKALRGWTRYVRLPCGVYSLAPLEKAEAKADAALAKIGGK